MIYNIYNKKSIYILFDKYKNDDLSNYIKKYISNIYDIFEYYIYKYFLIYLKNNHLLKYNLYILRKIEYFFTFFNNSFFNDIYNHIYKYSKKYNYDDIIYKSNIKLIHAENKDIRNNIIKINKNNDNIIIYDNNTNKCIC
jgi:hypothetical protein